MPMNLKRLKFDFKQEFSSPDVLAPDVLEIRLYGEVCDDDYNYWTGETIKSKTSQNYFAEKLDKYKGVKEIRLYINSEGGSVEQGYGIYANLSRHPANKICYIDGFANSIASVIAMACDKIIMYPNSIMGIHNVSEIVYGNAAELRKTADDLDRIMEGNREIYLQRSGGKITLEELTKLLDDETFLTAAECLKYGFCDEIDGETTADNSAIEKATRSLVVSAKERLSVISGIHNVAANLKPEGKNTAENNISGNLETIKNIRQITRTLNDGTPAATLADDDILACMLKTFESKKEG